MRFNGFFRREYWRKPSRIFGPLCFAQTKTVIVVPPAPKVVPSSRPPITGVVSPSGSKVVSDSASNTTPANGSKHRTSGHSNRQQRSQLGPLEEWRHNVVCTGIMGESNLKWKARASKLARKITGLGYSPS